MINDNKFSSKIYREISMLLIIFGLFTNIQLKAQAIRNPVLEFCTGTWCSACYLGEYAIHNQILPEIPNAIIISYHGYEGSADPFAYFPGNEIISSFGWAAYPMGSVDRVCGNLTWGSWQAFMNTRIDIPATVSILKAVQNYDTIARIFTAEIDFEALTVLNGEFNYSVLLLEDGIVWPQAGGGGDDYVHDWMVRAMMNGSTGELLVDGDWTEGEVITKSVTYTVPTPPDPSPDLVPENCRVVVFAYRVGTYLQVDSEIQQAEQWPLMDNGTSVPEKTSVFVSVFPNPATSGIHIKSASVINKLYVYNHIGQLIYSANNLFSPIYYFDVENFNPGLYFFKISSETGDFVKQVIIQ